MELSLYAGTGNPCLLLGLQSNERRAQEDAKAGDRAVISRITSLGSIRICLQLERTIARVEETACHSRTEIPKNAQQVGIVN